MFFTPQTPRRTGRVSSASARACTSVQPLPHGHIPPPPPPPPPSHVRGGPLTGCAGGYLRCAMPPWDPAKSAIFFVRPRFLAGPSLLRSPAGTARWPCECSIKPHVRRPRCRKMNVDLAPAQHGPAHQCVSIPRAVGHAAVVTPSTALSRSESGATLDPNPVVGRKPVRPHDRPDPHLTTRLPRSSLPNRAEKAPSSARRKALRRGQLARSLPAQSVPIPRTCPACRPHLEGLPS